MDKQIKTQSTEIIEYKKQLDDLNCEINRIKAIIQNLMQELENLKKPVSSNNTDRNIFISEFLKLYANKLLSRHKIKFLTRLILKRKLEQMMEKNKKPVEIKTTPITPPPDNKIKIVKRKTMEGLPETPGRVSYKRRNEMKNK